MTSLVEFIEARLAEDEQIARAAGEGIRATWTYDEDDGGEVVIRDPGEPGIRAAGALVDMVTCDSECGPAVESEQAEHIARHDPARVLREVESKRRIVEWSSTFGYTKLLEELALPYRDHPDYDPEWAS